MTRRSPRSIAAINGFGRFGFGLFRSWFEDLDSTYDIGFINDDVLTINDIISILKTDPIVTEFHSLDIRRSDNILLIERTSGSSGEKILITSGPIESASWLGAPNLIFDCSGRNKSYSDYRRLLGKNTSNIIIGATTEVADTTLIMGYNHSNYTSSADKVISFGSCTVIPGVHLLSFVNSNFGSLKCSVNIVHSVPKWQLDAGKWKTIARKVCSLESVAPKVIKSISPKDIKVNYTYAPYYGVSLMDFDFTLRKPITRSQFVDQLSKEIDKGKFKGIVSLIELDSGAESQINSRFSIVIVKSSIDVRDDRLYFFGYFNNEGSGIRLHELAKFIIHENNSDG
jgi:glyceraldehyde-3-phosphate dehydrogenase/erythrose-4-phosphate dehydrogenase